jgi:nitrite reductase/ring-hydroxylating ferredoxin subunit
MSEFVKVATTEDVAPGRAKMVAAGGRQIALFNVDGAFHAIDGICPHRGAPLSDGEIAGNNVTCPWHGATFDVTTGAVLCPPASKGVARYNVRVAGNDVEVEV